MMDVRTRSLLWASGFTVWAFTLLLSWSNAQAYEIQSGFSDGCHETLTLEAGQTTFADELLVADEVPLPEDETYDSIAESILTELGVTWESEREKFLLVSLAVGSRWPDTKGHPLTNSPEIRDAHVESDEQYNHALRKLGDDHEEGNAAAVAGTRETILQHLDQAASLLGMSPDRQTIHREIFVDYYGQVRVPLWGPAFHLGFAAHTLQDSFSHTIRSKDLHRIYHVMNFVEATRGELEEHRDGLPHSAAMDRCNADAADIATAAQRATIDLYHGFYRREFESNSGAVEAVLDEWVVYEPGCGLDTSFCDSPWVNIAEREPAQPFFRSLASCNVQTDGRAFSLWAMVLAVLALIYHRRRRQTPRMR